MIISYCLKLTAALQPGKLKKVSGPCLCGIWLRTDNSLTACLGYQKQNCSIILLYLFDLYPTSPSRMRQHTQNTLLKFPSEESYRLKVTNEFPHIYQPGSHQLYFNIKTAMPLVSIFIVNVHFIHFIMWYCILVDI